MKISQLLRSLSRSVHKEDRDNKQQDIEPNDHDDECTLLTVWRKSLLVSCNGFTVFDSNGNLVYRVDNYVNRRQLDEVGLMDSFGKSVLTMQRCKFKFVKAWLVYDGDMGDQCGAKRPIFYVRKRIGILRANSNARADVYRCSTSHKRRAYTINGSYKNRSCKILDKSKRVVAEIKKKKTMKGGISFGEEVFILNVYPCFDPGFAMAIVLLLDQM